MSESRYCSIFGWLTGIASLVSADEQKLFLAGLCLQCFLAAAICRSAKESRNDTA